MYLRNRRLNLGLVAGLQLGEIALIRRCLFCLLLPQLGISRPDSWTVYYYNTALIPRTSRVQNAF